MDPNVGFSLGEAISNAPADSRIHREAAQDVGAAVLSEDEANGAVVHSFDPNATPIQKAAAVASSSGYASAPSDTNITTSTLAGHPVQNALRAVAQTHPHVPHIPIPEAQVLAVDTGLANGLGSEKVTVSGDDLEAIRLEENDKEAKRVQALRDGAPTGGLTAAKAAVAAVLPGGIPQSLVGWLDSSGGTTGTTLMDLSDPSAARSDTSTHPLAAYIDPEFYGSTFHNGAIIIFAILTTRVFTLLRLGWGWTILLGIGCASYYTLSMERTRARARDDIQRELVKVRLVTETETADWINSLLDRAWLIAEPLLAATIVATVDDAVKNLAVPGIESIKLTTFTLGNKAPRLDSVRTYPATPDDEAIMEIALSFTPNDMEDLTPRQARRRVNPKIVLDVRVGVGIASKGLPILLEDISFTGKMRFKLKLMSTFPHVQTVSMSFMEKPDFDYVLKPIGGERFGIDINFIPGLSSFIKEQVHATLGGMMYEPNVFSINLENLLSGNPLESAIGVLKVTIESARGLKATKIGGGAPDGYVTLSLGNRTHVVKTKTISATANPTWSQSLPILVHTLQDILTFTVMDYNSKRADSILGTVTHDLSGLAQDAEQDGLSGQILSGGKPRGELRYSIAYYPVMTGSKDPDGVVAPPPDSNTGIVRLTIHQAKDLDLHKIHGTISSSARVFIGSGQQIFRTSTIKSSNEPAFEASTEFLALNKASSAITIVLQDEGELVKQTLGRLTIRLVDLLEAKEKGQDWLPFEGAKSGRIRLSAVWKPVLMAGSLDGSSDYVPAIGVMRLWMKKASDVRNVEGTLGGKSDPYVRVMLNNHVLARTEVINNNLNPAWDAILYIPVHSTRERLLFDLMDYQNLTRDRSLGSVELAIADYVTSVATEKTSHSSKGKLDKAERIKLDKKGYQGTLFFEASFIPAIQLQGGVSFANRTAASSPGIDDIAPDLQRKSSFASIRRGNSSAAAPNAAVLGRRDVPPPTQNRLEPLPETAALVTDPTGAHAAGESEVSGVRMSKDDLLEQQSGILVVQAVSGKLARRGRLEFLLDDSYWPFFSTERARSHENVWDQVGEGFVKELSFSRLRIRMNENSEDEKEEIFAETMVDTKTFLEQTLDSQGTFTLTGSKEGERCLVTISSKYIPVECTLEPRESINNQGQLRVDLLSGRDIRGVDRSGKSDPFVVFTLDGQRVFKSATQKKTLTPVWNEHFTTSISSRVGADFRIEVSDWNALDQAKSLGIGMIDLAHLEPFVATELDIPLVTSKHGQQGHIKVRLLFQPEVVMRYRKNTSTFSNVGRTATHVGAVPFKAGTAVGRGVIHGGIGVVHKAEDVGSFAGRNLGFMKKKDKSGKDVLVQDMASKSLPLDDSTEIPVPDNASMRSEGTQVALARAASRQSSYPAGSIYTRDGDTRSVAAGRPRAILRVTVGRASGLASRSDPKPYAVVTVGKKSHKTGHSKQATEPEWNETFTFTGPELTQLSVSLLDHKTLGKDRQLGSADVDLQDLFDGISHQSKWIPLSGGAGSVELTFDYGEEGMHEPQTSARKVGSGSPFKRKAT